MYPNSYNFPYSTPSYAYGAPTFGTSSYGYGRPDSQYLRALAEEEAARRQYTDALRAQEEARSRAARARLARQAYESAFNSYASDEGEDDDLTYGGYGRPSRSAFGYPSRLVLERQRLAALEREREQERERIRALEAERERRRKLLEEERMRRMMLEEEERLQREAEEQGHHRLQDDLLRKQTSGASGLSALEELLGLRPARTSELTRETPMSRRARTMSPTHRAPAPTTSPAGASKPVERASSRSPTQERIPININVRPTSPSSTSIPINQPNRASPSPQPKSPHSIPVQPPVPSDKDVEAATKIQTTWRMYHAQRTALQHIAEQDENFQKLKTAFILPSSLDYSTPPNTHEHVSVPTENVSLNAEVVDLETQSDVPKLAYTPTNAPLHAYYEELSRILTKLDGIQSGGIEEVRMKRRELARRVEREAEKVEKIRVLAWRAWLKKQAEESERNEMQVSEEASLPEDAELILAAGVASAASPAEVDSSVEESTEASMEIDTELSIPSTSVEAEPSSTLADHNTAASTVSADDDTVLESSPDSHPSEALTQPLPSPYEHHVFQPADSSLSHVSVEEAEMSADESALTSVPSLDVDRHSDSDGDSEAAPRTPSVSSHTLSQPASEVGHPSAICEKPQALVDQDWIEEFDLF